MSKENFVKTLLENDNTIYQQNDLIRAQPHLGVNEYRVLKSILSLIKEGDDPKTTTYQLDVTIFIKIFGLKGGSPYDIIKKSLESLQAKKLRKEYLINNKKCTESSVLISYYRYVEGDGYAIVEIPEPIRKLATGGTDYNKVELEELAKLKHENAMRLYEILNSWRNQKFLKIPVVALKNQMALGDKYARESRFVEQVVEKGIEEINESTNLRIKLGRDGRGKGKKMILTFAIQSKEENEKSSQKVCSSNPNFNIGFEEDYDV